MRGYPPQRVHLTPGQVCRLEGADVLMEELNADTSLTNKGYSANEWAIKRLVGAPG